MFALLIVAAAAAAQAADDRMTVSQLDKEFVLILGNGTLISRQQLLGASAGGQIIYERQDEQPGSQMVHLYGDTAVVTAKLWLKGTNDGKAFERALWFSDTYVRRADGWHYVLGQASLPLPPEAAAK